MLRLLLSISSGRVHSFHVDIQVSVHQAARSDSQGTPTIWRDPQRRDRLERDEDEVCWWFVCLRQRCDKLFGIGLWGLPSDWQTLFLHTDALIFRRPRPEEDMWSFKQGRQYFGIQHHYG